MGATRSLCSWLRQPLPGTYKKALTAHPAEGKSKRRPASAQGQLAVKPQPEPQGLQTTLLLEAQCAQHTAGCGCTAHMVTCPRQAGKGLHCSALSAAQCCYACTLPFNGRWGCVEYAIKQEALAKQQWDTSYYTIGQQYTHPTACLKERTLQGSCAAAAPDGTQACGRHTLHRSLLGAASHLDTLAGHECMSPQIKTSAIQTLPSLQ